MNKTRLRVVEDMLIQKEKIKSEDSSLRLDCTSDGLRASITAIEGNKLEQETSSKGKNIIPTAKEFWESGHYTANGKKVDFSTRMRLIDFVECEPNIEYVVGRKTYILRGFDKEGNATIDLGAVQGGNTFTTDENTYLLGVAIDKVYDEYDEELDGVMICKNSETDKTWEKGTVDMPSHRYKSEVKGVTGDINLKVQNKNLFNKNDFDTKTVIGAFSGKWYKLKPNTDYTVSTNVASTTNNFSPVLSEPTSSTFWAVNTDVNADALTTAMNGVFTIKDRVKTVRTDNDGNLFLGIRTNSYNKLEELKWWLQLEEGNQATTNIEHKEKNIVISLGEKTLYKGDRIIRKDGKWYFDLKWAVINDFSKLIKNSTVDGLFRASLELSEKIINTSYLNFNQGYSNILNAVNNGATYGKKEGFTVGLLNNAGSPILWIYINGFDNYTKEEYQQALNELGAYFIVPFKEEELELIEDENLINQLDMILTCITEYDDVTNFDFDNDVIFEIEVEKDKLRILENRLDKAEANTTSATMIALEKEEN